MIFEIYLNPNEPPRSDSYQILEIKKKLHTWNDWCIEVGGINIVLCYICTNFFNLYVSSYKIEIKKKKTKREKGIDIKWRTIRRQEWKGSLYLSNDSVDHSVHSTRLTREVQGESISLVRFLVLILLNASKLLI